MLCIFLDLNDLTVQLAISYNYCKCVFAYNDLRFVWN